MAGLYLSLFNLDLSQGPFTAMASNRTAATVLSTEPRACWRPPLLTWSIEAVVRASRV